MSHHPQGVVAHARGRARRCRSDTAFTTTSIAWCEFHGDATLHRKSFTNEANTLVRSRRVDGSGPDGLSRMIAHRMAPIATPHDSAAPRTPGAAVRPQHAGAYLRTLRGERDVLGKARRGEDGGCGGERLTRKQRRPSGKTPARNARLRAGERHGTHCRRSGSPSLSEPNGIVRAASGGQERPWQATIADGQQEQRRILREDETPARRKRGRDLLVPRVQTDHQRIDFGRKGRD